MIQSLLNPNIKSHSETSRNKLWLPNLSQPTSNPSTFPYSYISIKKGATSQLFYIEPIKHRKLNTPTKPCGENFNQCYEKYLWNKIGCGVFKNNGKKPLCTSIHEIEELDSLGNTVSVSTRKQIMDESGCHVPCEYIEYTIKGTPTELGRDHGFELTFATEEMPVRTEVRRKQKAIPAYLPRWRFILLHHSWQSLGVLSAFSLASLSWAFLTSSTFLSKRLKQGFCQLHSRFEPIISKAYTFYFLNFIHVFPLG